MNFRRKSIANNADNTRSTSTQNTAPTSTQNTTLTSSPNTVSQLISSTPVQTLAEPLAPRRPKQLFFSPQSTPAVPNSSWCGGDFLLGAGVVIIQPSTDRMLVVYDTKDDSWFLPKGRKDVGESLETAALREAYEESGYRAEFMPVFSKTRQPTPPEMRTGISKEPDTEPIFISINAFGPRRRNKRAYRKDYGGEYITSWYVAQIPKDAVHEKNTGMPDEVNYTSHLLPYEVAMDKLGASYRRRFMQRHFLLHDEEEPNVQWHVAKEAWSLYKFTSSIHAAIAERKKKMEEHRDPELFEQQEEWESVDSSEEAVVATTSKTAR